MPTFKFEAMDTTGGEVKDSVDAVNEEEAQQKIKQMGYFVTRLTEVAGKTQKGKKKGKGGAININIKIPGLGEFVRRAIPVTQPFPFVPPVPDYLVQVYRAFGARRMMWGSDYPPVAGREGYENALRLVQSEFAALTGVSDEDREWIFGRTALSVFPVR